MGCKECLHYDVCVKLYHPKLCGVDQETGCGQFKDNTKFGERTARWRALPRKHKSIEVSRRRLDGAELDERQAWKQERLILLAKRVEFVMWQQDLSQTEAARICGMAPSQICDIVNAKKDKRASSIVRLCAGLGVSADYLLGMSDIQQPDGWQRPEVRE